MSQILFENAALLDVARGERRPARACSSEDDRIVEVSDGTVRAAARAASDLGGRTLMPGLIDAHVHAVLTTMDLAALRRSP